MIERIHERTIFARLRVEGKRVRSGSLWCSMIHDSSMTVSKVAYAVGKGAGSAVVRNRIRRRLRPLLASHAELLPTGYLLIGASSEVATMPSPELAKQVVALVERLRKVADNA